MANNSIIAILFATVILAAGLTGAVAFATLDSNDNNDAPVKETYRDYDFAEADDATDVDDAKDCDESSATASVTEATEDCDGDAAAESNTGVAGGCAIADDCDGDVAAESNTDVAGGCAVADACIDDMTAFISEADANGNSDVTLMTLFENCYVNVSTFNEDGSSDVDQICIDSPDALAQALASNAGIGVYELDGAYYVIDNNTNAIYIEDVTVEQFNTGLFSCEMLDALVNAGFVPNVNA